ncbi:hypothetical protein VH86_01775 [Pantoea sp. BL1]|uniref:pentapeptide repeat-containing protein n=1 Tax=Pantoea sp. BL1 TaxID=1628190 RepID=UPI0005F83BA6|nr:pentapeptide repeat-containing protein [Pantoea sp. BL1]KJV49915.1 hypothetical protein VH86_01775 [Pantoea sp. BL1]
MAERARYKNIWEVVYREKNVPEIIFIKKTLIDIITHQKNLSGYKNHDIDINFNRGSISNKRLFVNNINFEFCDFKGKNSNQRITFNNCTFVNCYFGGTEFTHTNFNGCKFENTSLSLMSFIKCNFDDKNSFRNISHSGVLTKFSDTNIKSTDLIFNTYNYATMKYCKAHNKKYFIEKYKSRTSTSKLSRNILMSNASTGDDDIYYDSMKALAISSFKEKVAKTFKNIYLNLKHVKDIRSSKKLNHDSNYYLAFKSLLISLATIFRCIFFPLERSMLFVSGALNGWGGSLSRCIFSGAAIVIFYSLVYQYLNIDPASHLSSPFLKSLVASLDITFLAGYTKHVTNDGEPTLELVALSNVLVGLWWYAISIPTLINKVSTSRS